MSAWISVTEQPAPKDRVIEITSGFRWYHSEYYSRHSNQTFRSWKVRGMVALAVWSTAEPCRKFSGADGAFIDPSQSAFLPEFTYWREIENPFVDAVEPRLSDAHPPAGTMSEIFDGDVTLAAQRRTG